MLLIDPKIKEEFDRYIEDLKKQVDILMKNIKLPTDIWSNMLKIANETYINSTKNFNIENINNILRIIKESQEKELEIKIERETKNDLFSNYGPVFYVLKEEEIKKIIKYKGKNKKKFINDLIYKGTITDEIQKELFVNLSKRNLIKKRKELISKCYMAHLNKTFYYSVPLLLVQIEGIIMDYLIFNKIIIKEKVQNGYKYFFINNNGKKLEISGLSKKSDLFIDHLGKKRIKDSNLQTYRTFLSQKKIIVGIRNGILHGTDKKGLTRNISSYLILILRSLVDIFPLE